MRDPTFYALDALDPLRQSHCFDDQFLVGRGPGEHHLAAGNVRVEPGHCTGEPAFAALQQAFGNRYLYAGLGMVTGMGANPRADLGGPTFAMDQEDLRSYRDVLRRILISFGRPQK